MVDFWMGEWTKDSCLSAAAPPEEKPKRVNPIETVGMFGSSTHNQGDRQSKTVQY